MELPQTDFDKLFAACMNNDYELAVSLKSKVQGEEHYSWPLILDVCKNNIDMALLILKDNNNINKNDIIKCALEGNDDYSNAILQAVDTGAIKKRLEDAIAYKKFLSECHQCAIETGRLSPSEPEEDSDTEAIDNEIAKFTNYLNKQ